MIECWRLEAQLDDRDRLIARFNHEKDAKECGRLMKLHKKSIGYGTIVKKETILIYDSPFDFDNTLDTDTITNALAKLSEKEKLALGLVGP